MNTQEPNTAPTVEALTELIAGLLGGTYHCTRVWEAWNVGTMSEDDFGPVDESDTPREIAEAVLALLAAPQPAPQIFLADVRKVRDALDPDDWCGDERMIDVLDRALAEKPCCANWAAGTSCFADPRPGCPMLTTPQAPQRQPLTDQEIDDLYINGTKHWIGKREVARAVEALITSKGPAA